MAEENLAGIKIKDSYEGLLHLSDGGLNTSPGLWGYVKPVYDGQGRKTCLSLSSDVLAVSGTGGGIAIDSSGIGNPGFGDYGFIDQGKDGRGIGLRAADYQDGNKACDLYVGAGGNVGVGTEAPAAKLHVISPGTIAGNDLTQAAFLAGTVADGIGIDANEIRRNTGDFYIGTTNDNTTGTIRLNIGGTTALRIMSDGKVRYNYGTPVAGQVLKCTGSNGGMEWDTSPGGVLSETLYTKFMTIKVYDYNSSNLGGSTRHGSAKCTAATTISIPTPTVNAGVVATPGTVSVSDVNKCMAQNVDGIVVGDKCIDFPANVKVSLTIENLRSYSGRSSDNGRGAWIAVPCLMNTSGANATPSGAYVTAGVISLVSAVPPDLPEERREDHQYEFITGDNGAKFTIIVRQGNSQSPSTMFNGAFGTLAIRDWGSGYDRVAVDARCKLKNVTITPIA